MSLELDENGSHDLPVMNCMLGWHAPWKWSFHGRQNQDDFTAEHYGGLILGNVMESSRRFILQAEIEFWREMLKINRTVLTQERRLEMCFLMKRAVRELNGLRYGQQQIAA